MLANTFVLPLTIVSFPFVVMRALRLADLLEMVRLKFSARCEIAVGRESGGASFLEANLALTYPS